jgi:hypothetical protein
MKDIVPNETDDVPSQRADTDKTAKSPMGAHM